MSEWAGEYGWWGKYESDDDVVRKVYIGPMTYEQMLDQDDTYRHNFRDSPPSQPSGSQE